MVWPCGRRELLDVLEGEPRLSGRINENEPGPSCGVWLSRTWGLVTGPVLIAQELAVELRQPAGIGRVEDHRTQRREHLGHAVTLPYARRERRPEVPAIRDGTPRQNCDLRDPWRRDRAPECAHRSTRPDRSFAGEQNARGDQVETARGTSEPHVRQCRRYRLQNRFGATPRRAARCDRTTAADGTTRGAEGCNQLSGGVSACLRARSRRRLRRERPGGVPGDRPTSPVETGRPRTARPAGQPADGHRDLGAPALPRVSSQSRQRGPLLHLSAAMG